MIFAEPDATLELGVAGFASGLVGTIGVRIRDGQGADALARTTANIDEDVTVGGQAIYATTVVGPHASGQYTVVWDDGVHVATEDLVVGTGAAPIVIPSGDAGASPRDLITLAEARETIGLKDAQTELDPVIRRLITSVSAELYRRTGREFISRSATFVNPADPSQGLVIPDDETRSFYTVGGVDTIRVGDLAVLAGVTAGGTDVLTSMRPQPYPLEVGAPIVSLLTTQGIYLAGVLITVTGTWGFPEVPADVKEGVAAEVKNRYRRQQAKRSQTEQNENTPEPPGLAAEYASVLFGYRRMGPVMV